MDVDRGRERLEVRWTTGRWILTIVPTIIFLVNRVNRFDNHSSSAIFV